jgi:hypothetical protein
VGWWKNKKHYLDGLWWVGSSYAYPSSGSQITRNIEEKML